MTVQAKALIKAFYGKASVALLLELPAPTAAVGPQLDSPTLPRPIYDGILAGVGCIKTGQGRATQAIWVGPC